MPTTSSSYRRRWKRIPLDVRVKILISTESGEEVIHGRSQVISEGGMGITLTREVPKGTVVVLTFKLPGQDVEQVIGAELKYRTGFRCGFEFRGVLPNQRQELQSFCRHLTSR